MQTLRNAHLKLHGNETEKKHQMFGNPDLKKRPRYCKFCCF